MTLAQQQALQPRPEISLALQMDLLDAMVLAPTQGTARTQSADGQDRCDIRLSMQGPGHSDCVISEPGLQASTAFIAVMEAQL